MKKILSFVLVLAMVLGSVSMVFATDYPDVADTDNYAEAVNVLSSLGVIEGYNDGTFKPEKTISRAEAIKIVVAALGIPVDESGKTNYTTPFTDVPANAWFAGYVRYGVALKITEGRTATKFDPNAQVTYDEMIAFIMRGLGYADDTKIVGGYPTGYIMQAYKLGILDADSNTGTAPAPRGEIAEFLYNALDVDFVNYSKDKDTYEAITNPADKCTTMYDRLGANPETKTNAAGVEVPVYTVVDSALMQKSTADLSKYFGASVQLIKNNKGDIVGVADAETVFATGSNGKDKIGEYTYDPATVKTGNTVITNGLSATAAPTAAKDDAIYAVKLDSKGKVDTIVSKQIWTVSASAKIADTDLEPMDLANEGKTHTLLAESFVLNDDKTIDTASFILEGAKSLSDIKKDDVVYVYSNSKGIAKIAVGTEVVEGTVTKMSSDAAPDTKITVAGTEYKLAAGAKKANADFSGWMTGGNTIKAYLGPDGKIFDAKEVTSSTSTVYAILLKTEAKKTGITDTAAKAQFFTQNGETVVYEMTGKLDADTTGTKITSGTAIANQGELVKLTLNDKGKVTKVENAVALPATTTAVGDKGLVGGAFIDDATVVFAVNGTDLSKADTYSVVAGKTLYGQTLGVGTIAGSSATKIAAAIVDGSKIVNKNANYVIFTGFAKVKDGDEITVWGKDGKATYIGTASEYSAPTTSSATAYTLKFNADEVASKDDFKSGTGVAVTSITVNGEQVVINGTAAQVKSDIVVYTKTSSGWSVATGADKLNAAKGASLTLIDTNSTPDGVADIAVIIK